MVPRVLSQGQQRFEMLMPALIGLAGVVIGAVITGGIAWWSDRNDEIADERTAKRLVANEIRANTVALVKAAAYGSLQGPQPRTIQWQSQAATLARNIDEGVWLKVSVFYNELLNVTPLPTGRCPLGLPDDRRRKRVRTVARDGNGAYEALGEGSVPEIAEVTNRYGCYNKGQLPP